jgi:hypothetical protein
VLGPVVAPDPGNTGPEDPDRPTTFGNNTSTTTNNAAAIATVHGRLTPRRRPAPSRTAER